MVVDDAAFRSLQVTGMRQGGLTPEDLKRELPIANMSAEEIAEVIVRLQEVGLDVEVDASLFAPTHPMTGTGPAGAKIIHLEDRIAPRAPDPRAPLPHEPAPSPISDLDASITPPAEPQARIWPWLLGFALVAFVVGAMFLL